MDLRSKPIFRELPLFSTSKLCVVKPSLPSRSQHAYIMEKITKTLEKLEDDLCRCALAMGYKEFTGTLERVTFPDFKQDEPLRYKSSEMSFVGESLHVEGVDGDDSKYVSKTMEKFMKDKVGYAPKRMSYNEIEEIQSRMENKDFVSEL